MITTLDDVREVLGSVFAMRIETPSTEHVNRLARQMPDAETFLRIRLQAEYEAAKRKHLAAKLAERAQKLLEQLDLPEEKRDVVAQIEIEAQKRYWKSLVV